MLTPNSPEAAHESIARFGDLIQIKFAELVRLSPTGIADEMREEHRRRVLGDEGSIGVFGWSVWDLILEGAGNMVREEARRTLLREYDKWAKDHPDDATKGATWSFSRICKKKDRTF
jgi:hypothetical protein